MYPKTVLNRGITTRKFLASVDMLDMYLNLELCSTPTFQTFSISVIRVSGKIDAEDNCGRYQADLTSIHSEYENEFVHGKSEVVLTNR